MKKISTFGVDFDQYFPVSINFILTNQTNQIENISQSQPPKLIFFREILHTAVLTNMN